MNPIDAITLLALVGLKIAEAFWPAFAIALVLFFPGRWLARWLARPPQPRANRQAWRLMPIKRRCPECNGTLSTAGGREWCDRYPRSCAYERSTSR